MLDPMPGWGRLSAAVVGFNGARFEMEKVLKWLRAACGTAVVCWQSSYFHRNVIKVKWPSSWILYRLGFFIVVWCNSNWLHSIIEAGNLHFILWWEWSHVQATTTRTTAPNSQYHVYIINSYDRRRGCERYFCRINYLWLYLCFRSFEAQLNS